jgi:hypothetical protein
MEYFGTLDVVQLVARISRQVRRSLRIEGVSQSRVALSFCNRESAIVQKSFDSGHFVYSGLGMPLFPIEDGHLIAAEDLRNIDLSEPQIEPAFTNGFADRCWLGGIALYLGKVWTDGQRTP